MDGLKDEDKVEAWNSSWRYSLSGMALLQEDFSFLSVNSQWLKILEQPASTFYGHSFTDITPPDVREADVSQARLVIEGKIESYLMHKSYQFPNGKDKKITLLVTRVPIDTNKPFKFFLSRILLREDKILNAASSSQTGFTNALNKNEAWSKIIGFVLKYWLAISIASASIFGILNEVFQMGFF